jgi:hypothetical protein
MTLDEKDVRALLEEAAKIDDGGFTDRVMGALPARRPLVLPSRARWSYFLVAAAALAGCAGAYAMTDGGRPFARAVQALFSGHISVLALTAVVMAAMVAILGASAVGASE